jgi:predicted transposase/invertase (TIGR01784 family)
MPFRLLLYMVEIWRGVLKDTSGGYERTKEFRLPAIVPIILYNGHNNWTACRSYKEYLSGYELFGENIIDFKYILIDINRYTKEELLEASNLISTVFFIEQKKNDIESMYEALREVQNALKHIEPKQFELLKNWFVNIVIRNMDESNADKLKEVIQESKEGMSMVSNLELLLKEEFKKNRELGRAEGREEGRAEGRAEGEKLGEAKGERKKALEIAKNFIMAGVDISIIAKSTGLSEEELEKIKNEMN